MRAPTDPSNEIDEHKASVNSTRECKLSRELYRMYVHMVPLDLNLTDVCVHPYHYSRDLLYYT